MHLRLYKPDDLTAVIGIFRSNIPKYFGADEETGLQEFLTDRAEKYYVLQTAGDVVASGGIALNDLESPTVSLCWGMVRADFLGKGLGKELTRFRIGIAREKYPGLPLTLGTSQHTRGFYERFGFRLIERRPDGFGPGIDDCRMRLD